MSQLEEIKARAEKATPGPWKEDTKVRGDVVVWGPNGRFLMNLQAEAHWIDYPDEKRSVAFDIDARDATFIAHARTDVPKLIAALEAVLNLANHEPQFRPRMYGGEYFPVNVSADDIRAAITEALQ